MGKVDFDFEGRTILITGGSRGIGLALAIAFASWGGSVCVADLDAPAGGVVPPRLESRIVHLSCDVTQTSQVQDVVSEVLNRTRRLDVLVNNAGILHDGVLWKLTDADWDVVLDTHAGGTFRFTRAVVPVMRHQGDGRIINVTSYSGLRGNVGQANYSTAKAGVIGFTKTAAKELARFGITVNAISPNAATRMVDSIPPEKRAELVATTPLGRFAEPAEIAPAVGFLASDSARYITGVVLPVDGGISL